MENRKNRYVVKAKMLTKSSGLYDQIENVHFVVDGGKSCTCGSYLKSVLYSFACCECIEPGSTAKAWGSCVVARMERIPTNVVLLRVISSFHSYGRS